MENCDLSPEMKRLFLEKQKQRAAAKQYYRNMVENPYRSIEEGLPFDPALHRFSAMSSYHLDYFKPSPSSYLKFFCALSPMVLYYIYLSKSRGKREELLRSGVVSYEARSRSRNISY